LDKYRKDLLKIREEKKLKEEERYELGLAKKELEAYLKEFEHDEKKTKDIKEDIKKIDARLKELI
jgi:predicted  nucleic acid-binding Zn-ribbon protein